jgi:histidinol-phosphate phosphatase family protein
MRAVILAGGKGTRLATVAADTPKPLVPVLGRPVLEYQIDSLRRAGVTDVTLIVGHLAEQIVDYFGDGRAFGVRIDYIVEDRPLGTAGALVAQRDSLPEQFLVLYGDLMLDMDFARLAAFHADHPGRFTAVIHPNDHPYDSDLVVIDDTGGITGLVRKDAPRDRPYGNRVNAGVCVLDRSLLAGFEPGPPYDLERDVMAAAVAAGDAYGYHTTEYVKDMGTPDRYAKVAKHVGTGLVGARNLSLPQRAVFLDRDGTLNEHVGLLSRPDQLRIPQHVYRGLAALNASGFLAIVISNQPVVARNLCTLDELGEINRTFETLLGEHHVYVDDLLCCPHHPDRGYPEENPHYKVACDCRKPATALVERAVAAYNIDRSESWFVGDTTVDVQTGRNAGLRTVLLATGEAGRDGKYDIEPDLRADTLADAVEAILAEAPRPLTTHH